MPQGGQEDFVSPRGWVERVGRDGRRVVAPLLSSSMSTLTQLPEELLQRILLSCSEVADLAAAAVTCTALAGAARSNDLWHTLFQRDYALWFDRGGGNAAGPRDADDWRAHWQQSHRLCAVDCLQWRSPPVSPTQPKAREGHGAASLCDGRFVVVLGGFRPPPLDVFMFDSQATEPEHAWMAVDVLVQGKDGRRVRATELNDHALQGEWE